MDKYFEIVMKLWTTNVIITCVEYDSRGNTPE